MKHSVRIDQSPEAAGATRPAPAGESGLESARRRFADRIKRRKAKEDRDE